MSAFNVLRAGALSFMFILSALGGFAHGAAYPLRDTAIDESKARSGNVSEPFGLPTSMLADGPLRAKWEAVERAITAESGIIAACANDPGHCASQPALRFLEIVKMASGREGLARFGEINRAFNLAIRPVSDRAQYGVEDYWSSPLATLAAGAGDCEDYAIAKLVALRAAGVAAEDLRLLIIRETATGRRPRGWSRPGSKDTGGCLITALSHARGQRVRQISPPLRDRRGRRETL